MNKRFSYLLVICFIGLIGFVLIKTFQEKNWFDQEEIPSLSGNQINREWTVTQLALIKLISPSLVTIGSTKQQNFPWKPTQLLEDQINRLGYWISVETGKVLTASHLFDDVEAFYVIKNNADGAIISVDNIRKNENDLAVAQVNYILTPYSYTTTAIEFVEGANLLAYTNGDIYNAKLLAFKNGQIISDLPFEPGMSGSPLFDNQWVLIWINTAISEENGKIVTYAQPIPIPFSASFPMLDK